MNDHSFIVGLSVMVMLSCGAPYGFAQDVGDGMAVERASSMLDNEVRKLGGIKIVAEHLKKQFGVGSDVIYALREEKISYGEISVVLAMAEQMPGGINRDNLDEVISVHSGPYAGGRWEKIAGYLGIDTDRFIERINAVASQVPVWEGLDSRQAGLR